MPIRVKFTLGALFGSVLGAAGVSLLTAFAYALLAPDAFKDGQFALLFFLTVPFGGFLGLLAGVASVMVSLGRARPAGWVSAIGGGLLALLALLVAWESAGTRGGGMSEFFRTLFAPWVGVPFLCAAVFACIGWNLLRRK